MPLFRDTVPEFLRLHVAQLRDRIGPATIAQQLLEAVGDKGLADISSRDVRAFMSDMAAKGLKHATVNRKRATLSKIFNFALVWEIYLGVNPVTIFKPLREATGRNRYLSGEGA